MTGIVDWAAGRARMVLFFIILSLGAGAYAYVTLPKEGEPDIEIPALFVSVPFPGISAEDSERLLVRPLETELQGLDGLDRMSSTAAEGYAGVVLEFEFGWDRTQTIADVRDAVARAEARFPAGAESISINEINFSEFPILVISLSGEVPERTLVRLARELQTAIEGLSEVLEAQMAGDRDEMMEVILDPLALEAYDVTADQLLQVVSRNNQLIAAGDIRSAGGAFALKIPATFTGPDDIMALPVAVNGDRIVRLGDLADIRLTFQDRTGTARFNGEPTVALQVVKRQGTNIIDTVALVKERVAAVEAGWPEDLQRAININYSMDESVGVADMVSTLEASVLTAVALVMVVVLAALGPRSALLVGFAIPTSFMLCFALLAVFDIAVSNIVMFALILAVGMLVDGAIVVVEYADKRIQAGVGPMRAYTEAAKRMFWPIVASTATTLSAFLPLLFWPGLAGEFMGNLPRTLIFVLTASLLVALIYLPVVGGVAGRITRRLEQASAALRAGLPLVVRAMLVLPSAALVVAGLLALVRGEAPSGAALLVGGCVALSVVGGSLRRPVPRPVDGIGYRRSAFGRLVAFLTGNPVMPFVTLAVVAAFMMGVFAYYGQHGRGVEFFVETEPERAIAHVRARGNLSIEQKDALVRAVEEQILGIDGIESVFAFAGDGGLNQLAGTSGPRDAIGQVQIELSHWSQRRPGRAILAEIEERARAVPGILVEVSEQMVGPGQGKPVQLRLKGDDWEELQATAARIRAQFDGMDTLTDIDDTLPLPGIDWQIEVDTLAAGRYGADTALVGSMVQLVTRGILLDTMRIDGVDEEIDIRVRFPEAARQFETLDTVRIRTASGLVPLSSMITRTPVQALEQIDRVDGQRSVDIRADVTPGINPTAEIQRLTQWLTTEADLPASISFEWTGDQAEQQESTAFLIGGFIGALGLMFVILLTQFNSFYNAVLVLLAVVLSVTGVLIGMLVMDQTFSVIMTGTGIMALAGIVVNNNIVLIDTYQEYARYMPRLEAIVRTAEARIRPVLLTTITTMAGLTPMMLTVSVDFFAGGFTIGAPASLWWTQLATAVVFGLGVATFLTLLVTPALLAVRIWVSKGWQSLSERARLGAAGRQARADRALARAARARPAAEILWTDEAVPGPQPVVAPPARAAE